MMHWVWTVLVIYVIGFFMTLLIHLVYLQMVTPELALLRSSVWFIYIFTGWPHGRHLPMD